MAGLPEAKKELRKMMKAKIKAMSAPEKELQSQDVATQVRGASDITHTHAPCGVSLTIHDLPPGVICNLSISADLESLKEVWCRCREREREREEVVKREVGAEVGKEIE